LPAGRRGLLASRGPYARAYRAYRLMRPWMDGTQITNKAVIDLSTPSPCPWLYHLESVGPTLSMSFSCHCIRRDIMCKHAHCSLVGPDCNVCCLQRVFLCTKPKAACEPNCLSLLLLCLRNILSSSAMFVISIYIRSVALVLHFLFIIVSSYFFLLLPTLWH